MATITRAALREQIEKLPGANDCRYTQVNDHVHRADVLKLADQVGEASAPHAADCEKGKWNDTYGCRMACTCGASGDPVPVSPQSLRERIAACQKDLPPEFAEIVERNFWDLLASVSPSEPTKE